MRNRIAKLTMIGMTAIAMAIGAFLGTAQGSLHSKAAEYPGAWVKDPEYDGYPEKYQIDTHPDHYTFMVAQPIKNHYYYSTIEEEQYKKYAEYVIFATNRNGNGDIYVTVVNASGQKENFLTLKKAQSNDSPLYVDKNKRFTADSVKKANAVAILDSRMVVKAVDYGLYLNGYFDGGAYPYNGNNVQYDASYRLQSFDTAKMKNNKAMVILGEVVPQKHTQTTYYIGRIKDEFGKVKETVDLGVYTQEGLDGQLYHVPDAKDFTADEWVFVEFKGAIEGALGEGYKEGDVSYDYPISGYVLEYTVTDDQGTVTVKIFREKRIKDTGAPKVLLDGKEYELVETIPGLQPGQMYGEWVDPYYRTTQIIVSSPVKGLATDAYYYYEKVVPTEPKEFDVPTEGRTINLTKPLRVRNIAHDFIPSVPDVKFTYRIAYERNTNAYLGQLNESKDAYLVDDVFTRYKPVAMGEDSNKTVFEIWRGPIGGIEITPAVEFSHVDKFDNGSRDTVTKQINVKISGGEKASTKYFKRPGVYRYPIEEVTMVEIDHSESDKIAANVTGNDENGNRIVGVDRDVESDIWVVENKQLRYLDVYVEWNSQEDGFIVKDVVLHDISGDLNFDELNDQDQAFSKEESNEVSDLQDQASKKTGFSESLYTTYDLVIGKEIMGKGLTSYDIDKRLFKFQVTITGPAYTEIGLYKGRDQAQSRFTGADAIPANGVWVKEFEIKQNDYILLSGLPSGVTYEVVEIDNWSGEDQEQPAVFETYNTNRDDLERIIEADNTSLLNDHSARNVHMMTLQGEYASILSEIARVRSDETLTDEQKKEEIAKLEEQKTNLALIQAVKTDTKVLGKREAYESVNNVFFLNVRYDNVVTGVAMSVAPYALMVLAAVIGVGGFLVVKKRRMADEIDDEE